MILLTHLSSPTYRILATMLPNHFGSLIQPRSYTHKAAIVEGCWRAADNDAYNKFNAERFQTMLKVHRPYLSRCLFVVAPDSVGDHEATLAFWHNWKRTISYAGYPAAFVAQDGCTIKDVPWSEADALFIGGHDQFKDSDAMPIIREAKRRGLWVHVGRVNDSPRRLRYCLELSVDSIDGTAYAQKPDKMLRWYLNQRATYASQGRLL